MKNRFKADSHQLKEENTRCGYLRTTLHPCIINKQPHIIYPRGLAEKSPGLFSRLKIHYQQLGYRLKEDQRSGKKTSVIRQERRKWVPVLLFSASLMFESSACADFEIDVKKLTLNPRQQEVKLQLIPTADTRHRIQDQLLPISRTYNQAAIKSQVAHSLFTILRSRYKGQENDPEYIEDDLKQIANYYSDFPETVSLLEDLKDKNWQLRFDENNWVTTGTGNMLRVEKATIHFNTRAAAQLRLNKRCKNNPVCIASPADALLHELLHAHSMLVKSEEFIVQGGMNNVIYPYQHEYAVIDAERELYATMSQQDDIKRPQRREHTGRRIKAHCPVCIK